MASKYDIAGLIFGSLIIVVFFDTIFTFIRTFVTTYTTAISTITSMWIVESTNNIFYKTYSYMWILYNYLALILKDKYAVATLIAISIALTGLEIAAET